jgi:hypothetical protein
MLRVAISLEWGIVQTGKLVDTGGTDTVLTGDNMNRTKNRGIRGIFRSCSGLEAQQKSNLMSGAFVVVDFVNLCSRSACGLMI